MADASQGVLATFRNFHVSLRLRLIEFRLNHGRAVVAEPDIFAGLSSARAPPHAAQVTEQPTGGGIFALISVSPAVFQP